MPFAPTPSPMSVLTRTAHAVSDYLKANDGAFGVHLDLPNPEGETYDLDDLITERLWAPVVGTLAFTAARRVLHAAQLDWGVVVAEELARSLGVGRGVGTHSPLVRAVSRACAWRLVRLDYNGLNVCRTVRRPFDSDIERSRTIWTPA